MSAVSGRMRDDVYRFHHPRDFPVPLGKMRIYRSTDRYVPASSGRWVLTPVWDVCCNAPHPVAVEHSESHSWVEAFEAAVRHASLYHEVRL